MVIKSFFLIIAFLNLIFVGPLFADTKAQQGGPLIVEMVKGFFNQLLGDDEVKKEAPVLSAEEISQKARETKSEDDKNFAHQESLNQQTPQSQ